MQVAFVGLLPHPIRLWADMSLIKPHFFTTDGGIPAPKSRHTGIAAARRAAKKRKRRKTKR
ncbi:TPA: hypothetical protein KEZ01_003854 [Escherichia coli]|uniref:hypothetical protein n=1 Tax=Escherichia coli TaxID=562 RepID=UPI0013281D27|nr:hypothetical protein [Escherichia coli]EBX3384055.1 hypothetical protein [Salmonella enterica subsp. enterica serovar Agona]MBJ2859331.1 hypothetical protein [Salmonella enterica subsp. enterica serovar Derby]HCM7594294.1 hypothetical protein [Klebsiella pneumoniae]EIO5991623.1 hypothetical protein [Escherichia coli]MBN6387304.1 hypothetical protein [Escherichia coli]